MTDERELESADGIDRRTILKGTAAAGFAGAGLTGTASAAGESEVTFCATGEETFSYQVTVTGEVKRGGRFGTDDGDEIIDGNTGRGAVGKGRCDSWLFTGKPTDLKLDGPGKVFVNGKLIEDTSKDDLPNHVTIEAGEKSVSYKFRVSGQVERGDEAEKEDRIEGGRVRGSLGPGDVDTFRYSGSLAFDEASNPVTVTLDINPD